MTIDERIEKSIIEMEEYERAIKVLEETGIDLPHTIDLINGMIELRILHIEYWEKQK